MSKLLRLKEWLTVPEAAKHLTTNLGEEVTAADILRFALDGKLALSVNFINHVDAKRGVIVRFSEVELSKAIESGALPEALSWHRLPEGSAAMLGDLLPQKVHGNTLVFLKSIHIGPDRYLNLSDNVTSLEGVWDLPMIGSERLDIEHEYQALTGGPPVTLITLDGAFVEGASDEMFQLQSRYEVNKYNRLEYPWNHPKRFFPAGGLPDDAVIVVRTTALSKFVDAVRGTSSDQEPIDRAHVSNDLALLNQAARQWWGKADKNDPTTHPANRVVADWLTQRGLSPTGAMAAARLIRPEWAHKGRQPDS